MHFDFNSLYILENSRVVLRPLELTDFQYLLPFSVSEPELWEYSLTRADNESKLKAYIEKAINGRLNQKEYPFVVYDKLMNKYAGTSRYYDIDLHNRTLQLGYTWYGKAFQGTGLNKNCKYLLLEFAFEKMKMERVEFRADNKNLRSIAAMKSIGCIEEGILRRNFITEDNTRRDSIVLSILKEEWFGNVKNVLLNKC